MPRDVSPLSVHDVRPLNRAALLGHLRRHGPTTRAVLARKLRLSNSAITNVAAELLEEGVLLDRAQADDGSIRLGRPSTELAIAAGSRHVIGVQIGVGTVRVAICDLLGHVVARAEQSFEVSSDPTPALESVIKATKRLVRRHGAEDLLGVGVGAPGPVDGEQRTNLMSLNLGWSDVAIADALEPILGLPVVVDHNVRAMALAEARSGQSKGVESLAFIYVGSGVGAGLVMDGKPYRGGIIGVTEFGHLPVTPAGKLCICGNRGCLETVASERALSEAVVAVANRADGVRLHAAIDSGENPASALLVAAAAADPLAQQMVDEVVEHLAAGLVSLVNLLNPQLIVVGGYLSEAGDQLLGPLREALHERAFPMLRTSIRIEPTSFGADVGVVGAATVALDTLFYEPQFRTRSTRAVLDGGRSPAARAESR